MKKYEDLVVETTATVDEKLEKLIAHANNLAKAMNAAPGDEGGMTAKERDEAKKELRSLKDSYNESAEKLAYFQWAEEASTPQECMEAALRAIHIPNIKNASVKMSKKLGVYVASVDDARPSQSNRVNLINLRKTLGVEYFAREDWFDCVQSIALAYVAHLAKNAEVGSYSYPTEISKTFAFKEGADPLSKTSMIRALQETVDAILFIPTENKKGETVNAIKVDGRDYTYLKEAFTKEGNDVGHIDLKDTQNTARLIAQIIHMRLEGKSYTMGVG